MHPALDNLCGPGKPLKIEVWRVLDKCHNTRNLGEYEGLLDVDERLVTDLIIATSAVALAIQS